MSVVSGKMVPAKLLEVVAYLFLGVLLVTGRAQGQPGKAPHPEELQERNGSRPQGPGAGPAAFNFSKAQRSLVRILVLQEKTSRSGTGFLVSGKRLFATSNHVIDNSRNIHVGFLDAAGRARWLQASVRASDPAKDLAIVEAVEDIDGVPLTLASYEPEWASDVYAMGYPVAADDDVTGAAPSNIGGSSFLRPSVVKGIVSRVLDQTSIAARVQHQAPITPGYSGGPLLDRCGAVVGVSNSHHKTESGLSYAVLGSDLVTLARLGRVAVNAAQDCASVASADAESPAQPAVPAVPSAPAPPAASRPYTVLSKPTDANSFEAQMFRRAEECMERADIASARRFLELLAERGNARAMLGLALTYDPNFLSQITVIGLQPDEERARKWYLKALQFGVVEAQARLEALATRRTSGRGPSLEAPPGDR
jgi:hypothetical protein